MFKVFFLNLCGVCCASHRNLSHIYDGYRLLYLSLILKRSNEMKEHVNELRSNKVSMYVDGHIVRIALFISSTFLLWVILQCVLYLN